MPERALVVVTPWYPTPDRLYWGSFVRESARALVALFPRVRVVHLDAVAPDEAAVREERADGVLEVVRLAVPADPLLPRDRLAALMSAALYANPDLLADALAVHCHVGMPTAAAVVSHVPADAPFVLTEHASYLAQVFRDPSAAGAYRDAADAASAVTAVGAGLARTLRRLMPALATPVVVVPNPIDLSSVPMRPMPPTTLDRWVYAGNLVEAKGVMRLVRAFAAWHARRPGATLTVLGSGDERDAMAALAAELGVAAAVEVVGQVSHEEVLRRFLGADVLVHLSRAETFGIAAVEAVASGLPAVATRTLGGLESLDVATELRMVSLVDVTDGVDDVLEAVDDLEAHLGEARPDLVRADLELRFGESSVSRRLAALLHGEAPPVPEPGAPVVVAIALHESAVRRAVRVASDAARRGARAVLVVDDTDGVGLDDRVDVVRVGAVREAMLTHRSERFVVDIVPGAAVRGLRLAARLAGRPGTMDGLAARQQAVSRWWRRSVGDRLVHAHVDPLVVARYVLRQRDDLAGHVDLVVWGESRGIPLAARLLQGSPRARGETRISHEDLVTWLANRLTSVDTKEST